MTFTDHDMRDQVIRTLDGLHTEYDVQGIVDTLQKAYGTVDIVTIPSADYWCVVSENYKDAE